MVQLKTSSDVLYSSFIATCFTLWHHLLLLTLPYCPFCLPIHPINVCRHQGGTHHDAWPIKNDSFRRRTQRERERLNGDPSQSHLFSALRSLLTQGQTGLNPPLFQKPLLLPASPTHRLTHTHTHLHTPPTWKASPWIWGVSTLCKVGGVFFFQSGACDGKTRGDGDAGGGSWAW